MTCKSCGKKFKTSNNFCEFCGAPAPVFTPKESIEVTSIGKSTVDEPAASIERKAPSKSPKTLNLQAWAGWTWLVAKDYGTLSITETHLEHKIHKLWASNFWSIVVKIFNWGFDWPSSLLVNAGATDLRAINHVRIVKIDWLVWKAPILVLWTVGIPTIYLFSSKQLDTVENFLENLKSAVASAKFETKVVK